MAKSILASMCVAAAALFAWVSWGPLQNVFGDGEGDSRTVDYLLFGLPLVALSLACLVAAVFALRRP